MSARRKKIMISLIVLVIIICCIALFLWAIYKHNNNQLENNKINYIDNSNLNNNIYTNKNIINYNNDNKIVTNKNSTINELEINESNESNKSNESSINSLQINSNQIFKNIDITNVDNDQLNNDVRQLYTTLYNGTDNKNINNADIFIKNNFENHFSGSDKNVNNLIYRMYTTKRLDILSIDNSYFSFKSLNNIANIQSTYEFLSFTANITCHVIQYPMQEGDSIYEADVNLTQTIKISRNGKLMSLVNII